MRELDHAIVVLVSHEVMCVPVETYWTYSAQGELVTMAEGMVSGVASAMRGALAQSVLPTMWVLSSLPNAGAVQRSVIL